MAEANESASPSDMMDLNGFWEERRHIYEKISDNHKYQKELATNKVTWAKALTEKYPKLQSGQYLDSLDEAIRGLTFINYLVRNELRTADAPFLQPRVAGSVDPTLSEGIEDLIEKFTFGDFAAAYEQVQKGKELIDGAAFSVKHNIHMGLLPLYVLREEALGLSGHLRALEKAK